MDRKTVCPHCRTVYKNPPDHMIGRAVRCRRCEGRFVIRIGEGEPVPADPSATGARPAVAEREPAPTVRASRSASGDPLPSAAVVDWAEGDVILGLYKVLGLLGQGGMGRVYLVRHLGWNTDLAVKTPMPETLSAAGGADDFEHEAETWVNLGLHPHTVSCYYIRRVAGAPCLFAEYVAGGSLHDWIGGRDKEASRLYRGGPEKALKRILDLGIQFAWGLHYAHERGLVHQDVKPANVMVTPGGLAKVTDFGLARIRPRMEEAARAGAMETMVSGGVPAAGTPQYFSPEQARGGAVSAKADMWAWALCLLEMFKGGRSWDSGSVAGAVLDEYLASPGDGASLPAMPGPVVRLLKSCFAEIPEDRPPDMLSLAEELAGIYQSITSRRYLRRRPVSGADSADSLNNRAASLIDLGRAQEAEDLWNKALETQPHHLESTSNLGLLLWRSARLTDDALIQRIGEAAQSHGQPGDIPALVPVHLERDDCIRVLDIAAQSGGTGDELTEAAGRARERLERSNRLLRQLEGHTDNVSAVRLTPDGRTAVTAGEDRSIRIWNVEDGQLRTTLTGHNGAVFALALNGGGSRLLSGGGGFASGDSSLRLWDLPEGRELAVLAGHEKAVTAVCFDRSGSWAASASEDQTVRIWDIESGREHRRLKGHDGPVNGLWLSPDARFAISAGRDRLVRLWNVADGACMRTFGGHDGRINCLAVGGRGRVCLTGGADQTACAWDIASGRLVRKLEGHNGAVNAVCLSRDERFALTAGSDQSIRLWDMESGRCLRTFDGHQSWVMGLDWNEKAGLAVSCGLDLAPRLWRVSSDLTDYQAPFRISRVAASESILEAAENYDKFVNSAKSALMMNRYGDAAGQVRQALNQPGFARGAEALSLWSGLYLHLPKGGFASGWERAVLKGHDADIACVALNRFGTLAVTGSQDRSIRLWNIESGQQILSMNGHEGSVAAVCFGSDEKMIFSAGSDRSIRLWDAASGECLHVLGKHEGRVDCLCLTPDGRYAVSGGDDRLIRIWDIASGQWVGDLTGHRAGINGLCVSGDGRLLVSAAGDFTGEGCLLKIWDLERGACLKDLLGHERPVNSVCLSPDGRRAVSAGSDRTVRIWDTDSGECMRVLSGHADAVNALDISRDGRWAATGGFDQSVRIWNLDTGDCARVFEGHTAPVASVAFSPDGSCLVSAGSDRVIRVWTLFWELEAVPTSGTAAGADALLMSFLRLKTPWPGPLQVSGKVDSGAPPSWTEEELGGLLYRLGCAGLGWVGPEEAKARLYELAGFEAPPVMAEEASEPEPPPVFLEGRDRSGQPKKTRKSWLKRLFGWK